MLGVIDDSMQTAKNEDVVMLNGLSTQDITILEVKTKALHYTNAHYIYHNYLGVKRLQHISVAECAFTSAGRGYEALSCFKVSAAMHIQT